MTESTRSANGRPDAKPTGKSGPAGRAPRKPAGLTIERVFSSGVHPYAEVTWERRDVVQTNWRTGEVVFEQKGVEFPDFWCCAGPRPECSTPNDPSAASRATNKCPNSSRPCTDTLHPETAEDTGTVGAAT